MCYHLVSRVAHRACFLDDEEKSRFADLLRRVEFFCCVRVLAYCCMSNHIHVFIYLEEERELSEDEIFARVNALYLGSRLEGALGEWKALKGAADAARLISTQSMQSRGERRGVCVSVRRHRQPACIFGACSREGRACLVRISGQQPQLGNWCGGLSPFGSSRKSPRRLMKCVPGLSQGRKKW